MADKTEKEYARDEFADYLDTLSKQLRAGKISSEKGTWSVPENFAARIQIKEKKGRIDLKLNCRWSTLDDYAQDDREQLAKWQNSVKSVKKRMAAAFKEVTNAAEAGNFPGQQAIGDLVETSRIFAATAEPEWKDAMDEYMDHLENFVRAVQGRQLDVTLHEVRDLQYRMKACHKEFK